LSLPFGVTDFITLAIKYHPDKNPGDATAKENFQKLSKIYATLSDPQKRAAYDRYGEVDEEDEEEAEVCIVYYVLLVKCSFFNTSSNRVLKLMRAIPMLNRPCGL